MMHGDNRASIRGYLLFDIRRTDCPVRTTFNIGKNRCGPGVMHGIGRCCKRERRNNDLIPTFKIQEEICDVECGGTRTYRYGVLHPMILCKPPLKTLNLRAHRKPFTTYRFKNLLFFGMTKGRDKEWYLHVDCIRLNNYKHFIRHSHWGYSGRGSLVL